MGGISTTQQFTDGEAVTAAKLNAIVGAASLGPTAISALTQQPSISLSAEVMAAENGELRKVTLQQIADSVVDPDNLAEIAETTVFEGDATAIILNAAGNATKRIALSRIVAEAARGVVSSLQGDAAVDDAWGAAADDWAGTMRAVAITPLAGNAILLQAAWGQECGAATNDVDCRIVRDDGTVIQAFTFASTPSETELQSIQALDPDPGTAERTYRFQVKMNTAAEVSTCNNPTLAAVPVISGGSDSLPPADEGASVQVATPVIAKTGIVGSAGTGTITCATSGASIFYRKNGGAWTAYLGGFPISIGDFVESYASKAALLNSDIDQFDNSP